VLLTALIAPLRSQPSIALRCANELRGNLWRLVLGHEEQIRWIAEQGGDGGMAILLRERKGAPQVDPRPRAEQSPDGQALVSVHTLGERVMGVERAHGHPTGGRYEVRARAPRLPRPPAGSTSDEPKELHLLLDHRERVGLLRRERGHTLSVLIRHRPTDQLRRRGLQRPASSASPPRAARIQEHAHDTQSTLLAGHTERRAAIGVLEMSLGTSFEQSLDNSGVAMTARTHQSRAAASIRHVR
jgi:hypothetical protein